jgi:tetrahydromethanopterin S-methyltransferase subunit H
MRVALVTLAVVLSASAGAVTRRATLDVKDAEAREVLLSLKKQCGIRNMLIDPEVKGKATFYLRDVPCETAFRVVFRTYGLASDPDITDVLAVRKR